MRTKYHPLRKGFNECMGFYEKRDNVLKSVKKKYDTDTNSQPEAMGAKIEAHIPLSDQFSLNFDLY